MKRNDVQTTILAVGHGWQWLARIPDLYCILYVSRLVIIVRVLVHAPYCGT
jgi:hypothetical protein|eukprot:COSAG06_NODE_1994_length_7889_cov_8.566752_5_plen_51_part_00